MGIQNGRAEVRNWGIGTDETRIVKQRGRYWYRGKHVNISPDRAVNATRSLSTRDHQNASWLVSSLTVQSDEATRCDSPGSRERRLSENIRNRDDIWTRSGCKNRGDCKTDDGKN
jgi:hypothetical protein